MLSLDNKIYREKPEISFGNELGMLIQNGQAVKLPKRGFNIEKNHTNYTYDNSGSNIIVSIQRQAGATMYGDDIKPDTYRIHRGFVLLFDEKLEPYLISLANISIDVFLKKLTRYGFISKQYSVPFTDGTTIEFNDILGFPEIIQFAYRERYKLDQMKTDQAKFLNEILNLSYDNIFSVYNPTSKTLNFEIINGSNLILVSDPTGTSIIKGNTQTVHRLRKNGYIQLSDENISIKKILKFAFSIFLA